MAVYRFSKSRQGNNLVSDHFRVSEFACHDGSDEVLIDVDLVFKLEVLRQKFGRPMVISSGYRTPSWWAENPAHIMLRDRPLIL